MGQVDDIVCVITHSLYTHDGIELEIGGVQTYTAELCRLLSERCGYRVVVLQHSSASFIRDFAPEVSVHGIPGRLADLRKHYYRTYRNQNALTIFANFIFAPWAGREPTIALQHGIAHDGFYSRHRGLVLRAHKYHAAWVNMCTVRHIRFALDRLSRLVCVDLNFPNWVRAHFPLRRWEEKLVYVPNFGVPEHEEHILQKLSNDRTQRKVLIARRFEPHRGFPMIGKIISEISCEYPQYHFVFAGSGIFADDLKRSIQHNPNCEIIRLSHAELQSFYRECSVSIIPTLWSEGTSLACIESMCHGLTVVATNVGGLGNIVLGGFNGELVPPTESGVKAGVRHVLEEVEYARKLAYNGWLTAKSCFSLDVWRDRMMRVIDTLLAK